MRVKVGDLGLRVGTPNKTSLFGLHILSVDCGWHVAVLAGNWQNGVRTIMMNKQIPTADYS